VAGLYLALQYTLSSVFSGVMHLVTVAELQSEIVSFPFCLWVGWMLMAMRPHLCEEVLKKSQKLISTVSEWRREERIQLH
jgi:hypothetical protein